MFLTVDFAYNILDSHGGKILTFDGLCETESLRSETRRKLPGSVAAKTGMIACSIFSLSRSTAILAWQATVLLPSDLLLTVKRLSRQ